jgi:hypothetical protein
MLRLATRSTSASLAACLLATHPACQKGSPWTSGQDYVVPSMPNVRCLVYVVPAISSVQFLAYLTCSS